MRLRLSSFAGCAVADPDVVAAKIATIDRCLQRIVEVRGQRRAALLPVDVDDIVAVNLQRAIQAAIGLAAHVVATEGYGLPDTVAASFSLLETNGVIEGNLADRMRRMVGFRNLAVHDYQVLNPDIIEAIVTRHLDDLRSFAAHMAEQFGRLQPPP